MRDADVAAIRTERLVRRFGSVGAVAGLDLEVRRQELFGLVGPDGAGKTTTLRMLAGVLVPSSGRVQVLGSDPRLPALRRRIGLVPQEHALYGDLSIAENLAFFGRLFDLDRRTFRARREELLAMTRLAPFAHRRADALSGGMYKKLAVACALLHRPELVILDEPTNGVDPVSRRQLWELLNRFVDEGTTVVVSTSYMDEVARCHRVAFLHHGTILELGRPDALVAELPEESYRVVGGDRSAVHGCLAAASGVVAASPLGEQLRVLVAPGAGPALAAALAGYGARLEPLAPTFEDAYLAFVARADAEALGQRGAA